MRYGAATSPTLPDHLKIKLPLSSPAMLPTDSAAKIRRNIQKNGLYTVCQEASCPNLNHCWSQGTATFMIMGKYCTRRCGFCDVETAKPLALDRQEPEKLSELIAQMQLKHVVITSVDRDDLPDCGSTHFGQVISSVRQRSPNLRIEVLIPDFKAKLDNLKRIWEAKPDIINHNIETVPSLFRQICPQSNYQLSLEVLRLCRQQGFLTKSGIIMGLGESIAEVRQVIDELIFFGVSLLTIGQYLQPTPEHAPLREYISLDVFAELKGYAQSQGMAYVESGPLVRSSYHAEDSFEAYYSSL